jgi:hypothetical protein
MARLQNIPKNTLIRDLPEKDKLILALQWLHENPTESPTIAARCYNIQKEGTLQKAWRRERKRMEKGKGKEIRGGHNKILRPEQYQAMIRYAIDQAINGGKGATKQMLFNCVMWLRI